MSTTSNSKGTYESALTAIRNLLWLSSAQWLALCLGTGLVALGLLLYPLALHQDLLMKNEVVSTVVPEAITLGILILTTAALCNRARTVSLLIRQSDRKDRRQRRTEACGLEVFASGVLLSTILTAGAVIAAALTVYSVWGSAGLIPSPRVAFPEGPLDWTLHFVALTLAVALCVVLFGFWRRWARTPAALWLDVILLGLGFGTATGIYFTSQSNEDAPLLQLIPVVVLSVCLNRLHGAGQQDVFSSSEVTDQYIRNFEQDDEFSRSEFVESMVGVLIKEGHGRSRTIGLEGDWGKGKTSILRAVEKRVQRAGIVTIWIDSWQFRNTGRLIEIILRGIGSQIEKQVVSSNGKYLLAKYSNLVSPALPSLQPWIEAILNFNSAEDDVDELKSAIDEVVMATGKRFVLFIDDVERLSEAEVHDLMKTVRICGEIPNVTYVLAYDREQLMTLIGTDYQADFLDKIVEEEFQLPDPTPEQQMKFLEAHLKTLILAVPKDEPLAQDFNDRWEEVKADLAEVLRTPRQVKKLRITAKRMSDSLRGNVNPFDFLILELLRQRAPNIYRTLKISKELYVQSDRSNLSLMERQISLVRGNSGNEKHKEERKAQIEEAGDLASPIARLIENLFPFNPDLPECRRLRRICYPEYFERYFTLAYLHGVSPELAVEKRIRDINNAASDESRRSLVLDYLQQRDYEAAYRHFDYFRLFVERFHPSVQRIVMHSVIETLRHIPLANEKEIKQIRTIGEDLVAKMVSGLANDAIATQTVADCMNNAPNLYFAASLNRRARRGTAYGDAAFGNRNVDKSTIQRVEDSVIKKDFLDSNTELFGLETETFLIILQNEFNRPALLKRVLEEMRTTPQNCIRWLEFMGEAMETLPGRYQYIEPDFETAKGAHLLHDLYCLIIQNENDLQLTTRQQVLVTGFLKWYPKFFEKQLQNDLQSADSAEVEDSLEDTNDSGQDHEDNAGV